MKNSYRAEEIFKDLPDDLKSTIFEIAAGKLIYFPKNQTKNRVINPKDVLFKYAKSKKSYSKIGEEVGVTKVRIFQIIKKERGEFSKQRVEYWRK